MNTSPFDDDDVLVVTVSADLNGMRLDRALAASTPDHVSRTRLSALIDDGAVTMAGGDTVTDAKKKVRTGETYLIAAPPPVDTEVLAEDIPLDIVYEDSSLIVVNKPAGMVVHPAPGAESGTLVNALLAHCGDALSGIGGERRPGIVHRIDRLTSGLLVCAKTEKAHAGLAAQFAEHSIQRQYAAFCWGAPLPSDPRLMGIDGIAFERGGILRIDAPLGRDAHDRKKMAVRSDGRRAVTRIKLVEAFGDIARPFAARLECRLETGRTHQIRVHARHVGHPLISDPVYSRPRAVPKAFATTEISEALENINRQALHAETLGFVHPESGKFVNFRADFPPDLNYLLTALRRNPGAIR